MKTSKALEVLAPGAKWNLWDQDYNTLEWLSEDIPKPSLDEVNAKIEELKAAEPMRLLREERNRLIAETDWMANSDVTMSDEWRAYRQALRDLPANTTDPANPTWPTKPQ